jgi:hypothetical protein
MLSGLAETGGFKVAVQVEPVADPTGLIRSFRLVCHKVTLYSLPQEMGDTQLFLLDDPDGIIRD